MQTRKSWRIFGVALAGSIAFASWADSKSRGGDPTPFGLPHATIGKATTTLAGNKLYVGNLSFGTNDGVMIQLGHVRGWSMDIDPQPRAGEVPCETITCKMQRVELAARGGVVQISQQLKLSRTAFGKVVITTASENVPIDAIHVALLLNESVVNAATFPATHTGPLIVGDIGLTPFQLAIKNFTATFEGGRYILRAGVPIRAQISGGVEVDADEYQITLRTSDNNGNNLNWNFGSATITGSPSQNVPGSIASFGIDAESIVQFGNAHTALNHADIYGLASAADPDGGVLVSGIGSNGFDGVSIDLTNVPNSGTQTPQFRAIFSEPIQSNVAHDFTITGRGTVATGRGGSDEIGKMRWDGLTPNALLLTGNFNALGATQVRIEAYNDGVLVLSALRNASGPLAQMDALAAGIPRQLQIEMERRSGGFLRGPNNNVYAIGVKFDRDGSFGPYGDPQVIADEVRILPEDPAQGVSSLAAIDITGHGLSQFTIDSEIVDASPVGSLTHGGILHSPLEAQLAVGPVGELTVSPPAGSAGEFGASLDLGCAQGGAVQFEAGPNPLRVEESRTILKTYFETGKAPTEEQFTILIDSAIGGDETVALSVFGFDPKITTFAARLNGAVVDQVTHTVMPPILATGEIIDGAEPILVSTFAQDTDGNGGLDVAHFVYTAPNPTSITLEGSSIGPVIADELVITMVLPPDFLGQCISRMDVAAENMLSFSLRNPSIIQFDNPHSSPSGVPITALAGYGGSGHIDMFFQVGTSDAVMDRADALLLLYFDGPPGVGSNNNISGVRFDLLPNPLPGIYFNPREYTITKLCSPSLGILDNEASSLSLDLSPDGASRTAVVGPIRWMAPESIRSRVYAADGSILDQSPELVAGEVAVVFSPGLPKTDVHRLIVAEPGMPASGIEHRLIWESAVDIQLPGRGVVQGTELRIIIQPGSGAVIQPIDVIAAKLTATTDGPAAYMIANEETLLAAVSCDADIAAPFGQVDVFDLFLLLSNWNTNGPGADIAENVQLADVFDLFKLLSSWGDCP